MQSGKRIVLALIGMGLSLGLLGCSAEAGIRDGVQDGVSAALAALIQAPVEAWIAATFP